jgi:hypothetical protein
MKHKYLSQPHGLEVNAYNDGLHFAYNKDNLPEVLNGEFFEKRNGQSFRELPRRNEPPKRLLQGTTFRLSMALVLSLALAIVAAALAATMAIKLHEVERCVPPSQIRRKNKPDNDEKTTRNMQNLTNL